MKRAERLPITESNPIQSSWPFLCFLADHFPFSSLFAVLVFFFVYSVQNYRVVPLQALIALQETFDFTMKFITPGPGRTWNTPSKILPTHPWSQWASNVLLCIHIHLKQTGPCHFFLSSLMGDLKKNVKQVQAWIFFHSLYLFVSFIPKYLLFSVSVCSLCSF